MKKLIALLLAIILGCSFTACTRQPKNDGGNNPNPPVIDEPTDEPKKDDVQDMKLSAYKGEPVDTLELSNMVNINDRFYVYYFDLGIVKLTPLYTSVAIDYNYDMKVKFTFNKLTSEQLENTITKATETIDTHSYTGGFNIGFKQEFEFKTGLSIFGTNVKLSAEESTDHHWTNNWGNTVINSESTTNQYLSQYSNGYEVELNFDEENGYKKGYSYRIAFYETVKAYGVLIYDATSTAENERAKYSVGYSTFVEPNKTRQIIEESANGDFDYVQNKSLKFDIDEAIKLAEEDRVISSEVIHISTPQELLTSMSCETKGKKLVLDKDIDCANVPWKPASVFVGELDGQGYRIKNLSQSVDISKQIESSEYLCGFVNSLSGSIHDIVFDNITIELWKYSNSYFLQEALLYVGGVCGKMCCGGEIYNITIKNSKIIGGFIECSLCSTDYIDTDYQVSVGGIVGDASKGTIDNCTISNSVVENSVKIVNYKNTETLCSLVQITGGIVGKQSNNVVKNCKRNDDVEVKSNIVIDFGKYEYYTYVGGISGYQRKKQNSVDILNCSSSKNNLILNVDVNGVLYGKKEMIGDIVGWIYGK